LFNKKKYDPVAKRMVPVGGAVGSAPTLKKTTGGEG